MKHADFFKYLAAALVLFFFEAEAQGRRMRLDISEEARAAVSEKKLIRDIEFLSDSLCQGRATGSPGAAEAAFWLSRRFRKLGLLPFGGSYAHGFSIQSDSKAAGGRNIIGFIPGDEKKSRGYIIVAANYDGLGIIGGRYYPGADSNASGVAAMLGLAGMAAASRDLGRSYGAGVIFVALDAKLRSMAGSAALWEEIAGKELADPVSGRRITRSDIRLMVNLDQIGSSLSPVNPGRRDYLLMLSGGFGIKEMEKSNLSKGTGLDLSYSYYGSSDFTYTFYRRIGDHRIFVEHHIPSVLFTSGITLNNNKPSDTVESLDPSVLKRRVYLIWNWLERIATVSADKII